MVDLGGGGFLYRILKDIINKLRGRKASLSAEDIVKLRKKWKDEFESKILERKNKNCEVMSL